MIHVTRHATLRAVQRIAGVRTEDQARAMILAAIQRTRPEETGAPYVRLGTGERIVIEDGAVVTVLDKGTSIRALGLTAHRRRVERRCEVEATRDHRNDVSALNGAEIGNLRGFE